MADDGAARWRSALPQNDALDAKILGVALPSIANLAVIPIVGAVDTFWIGRMGDALALAGQGAANQVFFSTFFLIAFIPTITAPHVAKAAGAGDIEGASKRVCEALFLANVLGLLGTLRGARSVRDPHYADAAEHEAPSLSPLPSPTPHRVALPSPAKRGHAAGSSGSPSSTPALLFVGAVGAGAAAWWCGRAWGGSGHGLVAASPVDSQ